MKQLTERCADWGSGPVIDVLEGVLEMKQKVNVERLSSV